MVQLVPMNKAQFEEYLASSIEDYAGEHVKVGNWSPEKALQKAKENFHRLLPDGLSTSNQYLFTIEDETLGKKVGMLWFAVEKRETGPRAFVYDVRINESYRRQGYGTQAFKALERKVRELGLKRIMLHVFGHNRAARAMYAKLGYEVMSLIVSKTLNPEDGQE